MPRQRRSLRAPRVGVAAICLLGASLATSPTEPAAGASSGSVVHNKNCHVLFARFPRPIPTVRPHVPKHYALKDNGDGTVDVVVRGQRCESKGLEGSGRPTLDGGMQVFVQDPNDVAEDPLESNEYIFFWAHDNREVVTWLRQGLGAPSAVLYDDQAQYRFNPLPGVADADFLFASGPSVPSPFEIRAVAQDPPAVGTHFPEEHLWIDGPDGTTTRVVVDLDLRPGAASGVVVTTPGTPMAAILGEGKVPMDVSLSALIPTSTYRKSTCRWEKKGDSAKPWLATCD